MIMQKEEIEFEIADKDITDSPYLSPGEYLIHLGRKWRDGIITLRMLNTYVAEAETGDNEPLYKGQRNMLRDTLSKELRKLVDDKIYFDLGCGTYQLAEARKRKVLT